MSPLHYENYKDFFRAWLHSQPKRGHGQLLKIAAFLGVHTTLLTHIFKGDSHPTIEQALKLCGYIGLSGAEKEIFVTQVQKARAGDPDSRQYFEAQEKRIRAAATNLKDQTSSNFKFDERAEGIFYSDWTFSAAHLLLAMPGSHSPDSLAERLSLSLPRVHEILRFLLEVGLVEKRGGEYVVGAVQTFSGRDSPFFKLHLKNWRLRALEQIHKLGKDEVCFTHLGLISKSDFEKIQVKIVEWIKEFRKVSDPSPSETLVCLNIDWVKVR